jgi:hypothetical protein
LLKYQSVLRLNADVLSLSSANPAIELGREFQFHSTFICPVTKEQCTATPDDAVGAPTIDLSNAPGAHVAHHHPGFFGSGMQAAMFLPAPPVVSPNAAAGASGAAAASNPPVLLKCGHCISQHAMEKIVRTLRMSRSVQRCRLWRAPHHTRWLGSAVCSFSTNCL